jgi:hypothetical protein
LLLLLNIGLLAGGLVVTYWPSRTGATPEFNAEKIRLLDIGGAIAGQGKRSETPVPATPVASGARAPSCLKWPSLDADTLAAVEAHLRASGLATSEPKFRLAKPLGWWVYQPPFRDAEALRLALEAARGKGVSDLAPVRGGRLANALSLGVFPSLEKARAHAAALDAKGLAEVRFGPRPEAGEVRLVFPVNARLPGNPAEGWPKDLHPGICEADA